MKHFSLFLLMFPIIVFGQRNLPENPKPDILPKPQTTKPISPKFRVGAQVGYGHRLGAIYRYMSSEFSEFKDMSKHRSNVSFGTDFSYYLKQNIGFGIKYNGIYTSSVADYRFPYVGAVKVFQKTDIHYIGPFIGARYFLTQNRYCIFANFGGGYVRFRDKISILDESAKVIGNTAAFFGEIGFDFLVTKYLAIGSK